ncbi:MAG TPA: 6-carboxytetrahydropterin synthase [Gemmatimonadales bacterium]|nr:6-carboxytetrahydropterin synthase [Gemmatimonadales bacterium]
MTRRRRFNAAHRLHNPALSAKENRALFGRDNDPHGHGHNDELEVSVTGPVMSSCGCPTGTDRRTGRCGIEQESA